MPAFSGFSGGKTHTTPLPAAFFTDLLPGIDHLGELKICLYALWLLDQRQGNIRFFTLRDCLADAGLVRAFGGKPGAARGPILDALTRAVARGMLLRVDFENEPAEESLFFLNSPRGRAAVQALRRGEWAPEDIPGQRAVELDRERPNIFSLYEANIGPLTPLIVDSLREAEQEYPADWIEEAIQSAVENNVRRWRYVEAILRSRKENGRYEQNR